MIAKGNRSLTGLEVLPGAREERALGSDRDLIVRMDDAFDIPLEDFAEYAGGAARDGSELASGPHDSLDPSFRKR